jgi:hypothetical protein
VGRGSGSTVDWRSRAIPKRHAGWTSCSAALNEFVYPTGCRSIPATSEHAHSIS